MATEGESVLTMTLRRVNGAMGREWLAFVLLAYAGLAPAQQFLNDRQLLGLRLYNQSCRVCHTKPQLTSQQYAPVLSRISMNGNEEALRTRIADGTPRMPGFKYSFNPVEIEAIIAYLKTVSPPAD